MQAWLVLVLVAAAAAQEEDAGEDPAAETKAADDENDEAWKYIEYLRDDISDKTEKVLQDTLYTAKDQSGLSVLTLTVKQTLDEVMEIRTSLLARIKDIRKGEIKLDEEQTQIKQEEKLSEFRMKIMSIILKLVDKDAGSIDKLQEISKDLLRFKMTIGNEIMRIMMLPPPTGAPKVETDCGACDAIKKVKDQLEKLVDCANKKEGDSDESEADAADAAAEDAAAAGEGSTAGSEECMAPAMYAMELITITEGIDDEIKILYNGIIAAVEDETRETLFTNLQEYKDLRTSLDDLIPELMDEKDDDKRKKIVQRNLQRLVSKLKTSLSNCKLVNCPDDAPCESCAADVLNEVVQKLENYVFILKGEQDDESKKEEVRTDLIKVISEQNDAGRKILEKKATEGVLDECDDKTLATYTKLKAPMWMLVNTTIFRPVMELEEMVDALIEMSKEMQQMECDNDAPPPPSPDGPNCEWDEYEQHKQYLTVVDEVIQDALFKGGDDSEKATVLIKFVEIQSLYDDRVKKLFEDKLVCPGEVQIIKEKYMKQLTTCMAEFMRPSLKFSKATRLQRIGCIKVLRTAMEDRMSELLRIELEQSLNQINQGGGGSGSEN